MKADKLEKYLDELSDRTDFDFRISEIKNSEVELYMQVDNPCNEDWCTEITIKNPKTKKELIETLHEKIWELYDDFDVEEETYLMLEAKRNGFQGVPGVVDLVHNEEYKENALKEFAEKLRDLLYEGWLMEMKSTNAEEVACNFKDWLVDLGYMTLEDGIQDEQEIVNDFYVLEEKCPKLFNLFRDICDR